MLALNAENAESEGEPDRTINAGKLFKIANNVQIATYQSRLKIF